MSQRSLANSASSCEMGASADVPSMMVLWRFSMISSPFSAGFGGSLVLASAPMPPAVPLWKDVHRSGRFAETKHGQPFPGAVLAANPVRQALSASHAAIHGVSHALSLSFGAIGETGSPHLRRSSPVRLVPHTI